MTLHERLSKQLTRAMALYQLIADDDRILVALSGGKDSLCLLQLLAERASIAHPRFSLVAVHVRMTNVHYETSTAYLEQFCERFGVPLHVVTTGFEIGGDSCKTGRDLRRQKSPCFLCSWNRRKQLFNLAQELGCNKIALGHHQDDIIHTAFMNLTFQGRFGTMPALLKMRKMPISIIRPLCMIAENDIRQFADEEQYERQQKSCPYEHESQRTHITQLFNLASQLNLDARQSIWNALDGDGKLVEEY